MDYTWMFYKDHESINALLEFFAKPIKECPEELIVQIEGEIQTNYVHEGNNQQGRSFVQQSAIEGIGAALEAVRAECVQEIRRRARANGEELSFVSAQFVNLGIAQKELIS